MSFPRPASSLDLDARTLAVGFFDGVHLGHQKILRQASEALTFQNHPLSLLAPDKAPRLIMTPEERLQAIRACGVEHVTMLPFTQELANLSPERFIAEFVSGKKIICGENWHFGKGGKGNADFARACGCDVTVVSAAEYRGARISSTRLRECLLRGEIDHVTAMLGRPYTLTGLCVSGKGLGRQLGYPTINVRFVSEPPCSSVPMIPFGVYEVRLKGMKGLANFGHAPTLGERAWTDPILEIHLLSENLSQIEMISENRVTVELLRFLRPEKKFASIDDLKRQIASDCAKICT